MGLLEWYQRRHVVIGSKVLVCSLNAEYDSLLDSDTAVYRRFYSQTNSYPSATVPFLLHALTHRYDVLHVFCKIQDIGTLIDGYGNTVAGTDLLQTCRINELKLLWISNNNDPDVYMKAFQKKPGLNLVMTIDRKGQMFSAFLDHLLSTMSRGRTMPRAWSELAPQIPGNPQNDLPDCIYLAGRPSVILSG